MYDEGYFDDCGEYEDQFSGREYEDDDYEPDVDESQENNDFAHDSDMDNFIIEDQFLDGMHEE